MGLALGLLVVARTQSLAVAAAVTAVATLAAPFSRAQANVTPIVFDVVRPSALVMVAGVAVLAVANSVGEELLWRGALAHEGRVLPVAAQYCLQVVSFGLAHWHGLPGG